MELNVNADALFSDSDFRFRGELPSLDMPLESSQDQIDDSITASSLEAETMVERIGAESNAQERPSPCNKEYDPIKMQSSAIPHRGSLCRNKLEGNSYVYTMMVIQGQGTKHKSTLQFSSEQYEFLENIFTILDTESSGFISRQDLKDFVLLRCPVFKRRDRNLVLYREYQQKDSEFAAAQDLKQGEFQSCQEMTFDQVWNSVMACAVNYDDRVHKQYTQLGLEGWMLFARFISLAQYHDAKRQFSARHLQTAGTGGNEGHKEEMVIVDLPPLDDPPAELNVDNLIEYDLFAKRNVKGEESIHSTYEEGVPLPELDLDHSYISIYDNGKHAEVRDAMKVSMPIVQVSVFGSSHTYSQSQREGTVPNSGSRNDSGNNANILEFVIKYLPSGIVTNEEDTLVVRRSIQDLQWLHETFESHKLLGGTLCGRILPPFPSKLGSTEYPDYGTSESLSTNSAAVAVASAGVSAGVEIVSSAAKTAKTLWESIPGSKKISKMVQATPRGPAHQATSSRAFSKIGYKKHPKDSYHSPHAKSRRIEKYLNYLLEHPALSTSFPLNLILKASQSGLDASKRIFNQLQMSNITEVSHDVKTKERNLSLASSLLQYLPSPSNAKNLDWVRSAAQAALVLKVHGLLETAGYQSTSTTLQHASLPQFSSNNDHEGMDSVVASGNEDTGAEDCDDKDCISELGNESHDEYDGFDVLPHPLPLPERSALCAGNVYPSQLVTTVSETRSYSTYTYSMHERDHYGTTRHTSLGDIEVERDIERLRELLQRVDRCFASCCNALGVINEHRRSKEVIHVNILRSIDTWQGMRGKILSQRSLLNGVRSLEEANRAANDSYTHFGEDMMWSALLASSAYSASKDVCRAVEVAQTASRAKQTADTAVQNAIDAEKETCATDEEAEVLHKRVTSSKTQALYAAVVHQKASSAKRRSVVSLANDIKYWNAHRKHELLKTCLDVVKEQRRSAEDNMNAWKHLKGGLLDSRQIFGTSEVQLDTNEKISGEEIVISEPTGEQIDYFDDPTSSATVELGDSACECIQITGNLVESFTGGGFTVERNLMNDVQLDYFTPSASHNGDLVLDAPSPSKSGDGDDWAPNPSSPHLIHDSLNDEKVNVLGDFEDNRYFTDNFSQHSETGNHDVEATRFDCKSYEGGKKTNQEMTDSMQSLVDGLLTWGGNWEAEEDLGLALPRGMAASLALEESGILDVL